MSVTEFRKARFYAFGAHEQRDKAGSTEEPFLIILSEKQVLSDAAEMPKCVL